MIVKETGCPARSPEHAVALRRDGFRRLVPEPGAVRAGDFDGVLSSRYVVCRIWTAISQTATLARVQKGDR